MKKLSCALVVGWLITLSGCAGFDTLSDLQSSNDAEKGNYEVNGNYQNVYRMIVESGKVPNIEGRYQLYPNLTEGKIWIQASYGGSYLASLVLKPNQLNPENATTVQYSCIKSWVSWCESVKQEIQK